MKLAIARIFNGFLTGVGFSIALVLALTLRETVNTDDLFDNNHSGLSITNVKETRYDYRSVFTGTLINESQHAWGSINIAVTLFNQDSEYVDSCDDFATRIAHPGESIYFKVTCGWKNNPVSQYSDFKAEIAHATKLR